MLERKSMLERTFMLERTSMLTSIGTLKPHSKRCYMKSRSQQNQAVGKAVGTLAPVLNQIDTDNCVATPSGKDSRVNAKTDISLVVSELIKLEAFVKWEENNTFPHPKKCPPFKGKR